MTDEERKAIRNLENLSVFGLSTSLNQADLDKMEIVLNLIEKQTEKIDYYENILSAMEDYYSITIDDIEKCIREDK